MDAEALVLSDAGFSKIVGRLEALAAQRTDRRVVIGIGGIAGSGKSTLAQKLADAVGGAVALGLDGFHLPNATLRTLGRYDRKGAPDTYDAEGFIELLRRYRDPAATGPYPVYDREHTHDPITAPRPIDASVRVIIAEGQFMLLDRPPWDELSAVFDETWLMDTSIETAKAWILGRHTSTGRTPEQAAAKYENDLRNSRLVLAHQRDADLRLVQPGSAAASSVSS